MHTPISVIEFIRTGRFGSLSLGSSKREVEAEFGEADAVAPVVQGKSPFSRYGEVFFWWQNADDRLQFISIEFEPQREAKALTIDLDPLRPHMLLGEAIEVFRELSIPYQLAERPLKWDFLRLYVGVGVRLVFNDQNPDSIPLGLLAIEYDAAYPRPSEKALKD
jgi:hypothetical protein